MPPRHGLYGLNHGKNSASRFLPIRDDYFFNVRMGNCSNARVDLPLVNEDCHDPAYPHQLDLRRNGCRLNLLGVYQPICGGSINQTHDLRGQVDARVHCAQPTDEHGESWTDTGQPMSWQPDSPPSDQHSRFRQRR